jgi:hypothetical protein
MSCDTVLQQICDELAEDIQSEVCENIRFHLANCPQCNSQLTSMRNAVQLFRCLREQEVPSAIHNRLVILLNMPDVNA